jgi:predicted MFS family arabinose efflux permease
MYISLEVGIGTGALFSGWIYHNESSQFVYAFLTPGILAFIACALLIRWNKKRALA